MPQKVIDLIKKIVHGNRKPTYKNNPEISKEYKKTISEFIKESIKPDYVYNYFNLMFLEKLEDICIKNNIDMHANATKEIEEFLVIRYDALMKIYFYYTFITDLREEKDLPEKTILKSIETEGKIIMNDDVSDKTLNKYIKETLEEYKELL